MIKKGDRVIRFYDKKIIGTVKKVITLTEPHKHYKYSVDFEGERKEYTPCDLQKLEPEYSDAYCATCGELFIQVDAITVVETDKGVPVKVCKASLKLCFICGHEILSDFTDGITKEDEGFDDFVTALTTAGIEGKEKVKFIKINEPPFFIRKQQNKAK